MRNLFLLCAVLFISAAAFAQATPLTVKNGTSCEFWVYGYASPGGCGLSCSTGPVCCPPGAATVIAPCGPATLVWEAARIVGTDPTCTAACPGPSLGVSALGSACPFPNIAGGNHCICGPFVADFSQYVDVLYIQ